mmetsp:Transcript_9546/g.23337  ORF Transcript_9546/g.23337 Transcript_9546/m.23337 type:complete len:385 (+) Transcript_9546:113-1267(+)
MMESTLVADGTANNNGGGGNTNNPLFGGDDAGADGGLFGSLDTPAPATTTTTTATTTTPAAGKPDAKTAQAPAAGGFSFGGTASAAPTTVAPTTKDAAKDGAAAATTPAAKTGFSFGATTPGTTPAAKVPSPVKTPATVGGGAAAPGFASPPAAAPGAAASTATPAAAQQPGEAAPKMIEPPPIEYQSLTIEQILNRFQSELETDAIAFLNEAQRIAHYDATLRDTQHSLSELTNMVSRLMLHQTEVDTQLQGIGSYQNELGTTLDLLERNVDELFAAQSNVRVEDADVERERSYERAIEVDHKLDAMGGALRHVVNDLNAAQERVWSSSSGVGGGGERKDEEVGKIIGVFNAHHETLAHLESKARGVESDLAMITQVLAKSGQ